MVITPGGAGQICQLRKISNIQLKFLTIKPIDQKQLPESVLQKKCSQKFRETDGKKPVSDTVNFAKFSRTIFLLNTSGGCLFQF